MIVGGSRSDSDASDAEQEEKLARGQVRATSQTIRNQQNNSNHGEAKEGGLEVHNYELDRLPETFDFNNEELTLVNYRMTSLTPLQEAFPKFSNLTSLVLRQNKLQDLTGIELLKDTLTNLDLYENNLTTESLVTIGELINLQTLDLSFNDIRVVNHLQTLVGLQHLYLIRNKIRSIGGLSSCKQLQTLELGYNRIREIQKLDELVELKELYLGSNKITEVKNLSELKNLQKLSLQCNRLVKIGSGLQTLVHLRELYVSDNGIEALDGLETLTELTLLDAGMNRLTDIGSTLQHLPNLTDVWLNNNRIQDWKVVEKLAQLDGKLNVLYLEHNPVAQTLNYVQQVLQAIPSLTTLDALEFEPPTDSR